jgi:hypothetical protein
MQTMLGWDQIDEGSKFVVRPVRTPLLFGLNHHDNQIISAESSAAP